jgi:hypothetical protein
MQFCDTVFYHSFDKIRVFCETYSKYEVFIEHSISVNMCPVSHLLQLSVKLVITSSFKFRLMIPSSGISKI